MSFDNKAAFDKFLKSAGLLAEVRMQSVENPMGDVGAYMHPLYSLYAVVSIGGGENVKYLRSLASSMFPQNKTILLHPLCVEKEEYVVSIQPFTLTSDHRGYIERYVDFLDLAEKTVGGAASVLPAVPEFVSSGVLVPRMIPDERRAENLSMRIKGKSDMEALYDFFTDGRNEHNSAGKHGEYDNVYLAREETRTAFFDLLKKTRHLWARIPTLDDLNQRAATILGEDEKGRGAIEVDGAVQKTNPLEFVSVMLGVVDNSMDMASVLGKNTDSVFWLNKALYNIGVKRSRS